MTAMPTYAERLARWSLEVSAEDVPAGLLADSRLRVLDILGAVLVGSRQPLGLAVYKAALSMGSSDQARLMPWGDAVPATSAALVTGTLAHATDFDDTHNASLVHSSGPVVAAALAAGQMMGASGAAVLNAVLVGNEVCCRLGMVAPMAFHRHGLHPTGVLGPVAATLVAARLMGLSLEQAVHGMGISGSEVSGTLESFTDGTWVKTLHPGWAAHNGLVSALLAQAGFTGPATVLEGRFGLYPSHVQDEGYDFDYDALVRGLGKDWEIRDNSFKPYACAHVIHPFVDLVLELRAEGLGPEDVERIDMPITEGYIPVVGEPRAAKLAPRTPTHARASLPYCVAAALVLGHLEVSAFEPPTIHDRRILDLAAKLYPVADPDPAPKGQFRGCLEVVTRSGERIRRVQEHNRGSRQNPMSEAEIVHKFERNADGVLPPARIERVAALCLSLDGEEDIGRLVDACIRA